MVLLSQVSENKKGKKVNMKSPRKRKLLVVDAYPTKGVANKIDSIILEGQDQVFVSRKDIVEILKNNNFKKAPKTAAFLNEIKSQARAAGAYFLLLKQAVA